MRLLTTVVSGAFLFALANAQSATGSATGVATTTSGVLPATTSTAAVSGTQGLTPAQSSQAACLSACMYLPIISKHMLRVAGPATDPSCRAACVPDSAPSGDYAQQNATINCIASCDHGDGTAAENLVYQDCLKDCVASATITPASTAAPTTEAGSTATATGDAGSAATTTGDAGSAASATGDAGSENTESANTKTTMGTGTGSGCKDTSVSWVYLDI